MELCQEGTQETDGQTKIKGSLHEFKNWGYSIAARGIYIRPPQVGHGRGVVEKEKKIGEWI